MKTRIVFHGAYIQGYFIRRVAVDRFLFYVPTQFQTIKTIVGEPFLNLWEGHLQLSHLYIFDYPINPNCEV